ncbi:Gti1/Pac2 family-domain-containing protein [Mycena rebaudengoi]|nr:Gti1/Pac2 family-domain-containing protein [Mycena rebaudengoi]
MNVFNSVPSLTHPRLQIRNCTDAQVLLEAVRLKVLPLIKHRLAEHERAELQSGNVYVWEESDDQSSLCRWTDGRRWSQSRTRGDCLFYQEKIEMTFEEKQAKAARRWGLCITARYLVHFFSYSRALKASDLPVNIPSPCRRTHRPSKVNGLTKQTYTANVRMLDSGEIRKWHIVAYYTDNDLPRLPTVDDFDYLRRIRIPDGIYASSHTFKSNNNTACERTPPPDEEKSHNGLEELSTSFQITVWPHTKFTDAVLPRPTASGPIAPGDVKLPPLSSIGPFSKWRPRHRGAVRAPPHISICSEDRKTLNKFRIVI